MWAIYLFYKDVIEIVVVVELLSRVWLYSPMDYWMSGSSFFHYHLEFTQIHVHCIGDRNTHT